MHGTKRIIKNTIFLYLKMGLSIFIALYSTRIVLATLGQSDFGIYNIVGGVITMLAFVSTSMIISTQRYISYYIGLGHKQQTFRVFKTSVRLHLLLALATVAIFEIIGFFIFNGVLNIPENRIATAKLVYQLMIITTFFTINAVPYDALINAHEDMWIDALLGILESLLKLAIAFLIVNSTIDHLLYYAICMALLTIGIRIVKSLLCYYKYEESKARKTVKIDKSLIKEMFSFAGWSSFGLLSNMARLEGITLLINVFFSTLVNAAFAIANQVNSQLYAFSVNMLKAIEPQIVKSEGSGQSNKMLQMSIISSKFGFFLLAFFAIPFIVKMPYILNLWLKNVPLYTSDFCRWILAGSLIKQLTIGAYASIQAKGNIKQYQLKTGISFLLNIPLTFLLFYYGYPPFYAGLSIVIIEVMSGIISLYYWHKIVNISYVNFIKEVLKPIAVTTVVSVLMILLYSHFFSSDNILGLIVLFLTWWIIYLISIYFGGLNTNEKSFINSLFLRLKVN